MSHCNLSTFTSHHDTRAQTDSLALIECGISSESCNGVQRIPIYSITSSAEVTETTLRGQKVPFLMLEIPIFGADSDSHFYEKESWKDILK